MQREGSIFHRNKSQSILSKVPEHSRPRAWTIQPGIAYQRVQTVAREAVRSDDIMVLQRTIGNQAVMQLLQAQSDGNKSMQRQAPKAEQEVLPSDSGGDKLIDDESVNILQKKSSKTIQRKTTEELMDDYVGGRIPDTAEIEDNLLTKITNPNDEEVNKLWSWFIKKSMGNPELEALVDGIFLRARTEVLMLRYNASGALTILKQIKKNLAKKADSPNADSLKKWFTEKAQGNTNIITVINQSFTHKKKTNVDNKLIPLLDGSKKRVRWICGVHKASNQKKFEELKNNGATIHQIEIMLDNAENVVFGGIMPPAKNPIPHIMSNGDFLSVLDRVEMLNVGGEIYVSEKWLSSSKPPNHTIMNHFVHEMAHGYGGYLGGRNAIGDFGHSWRWVPGWLKWYGPGSSWIWTQQ